MIDDISSYKLENIVSQIDELGYSDTDFTRGYEINEKYDYRNYDIDNDNKKLKGLILLIKNGYEVK